MEETSMCLGMPETDITTLKEALQAQQKLLQKLYSELDEEREASASAASETLSVILRLQGEKAAVKMEASQYKRMAEEKMYHAEESLAVFEDLMFQKEMEIAALEFQVQSYRCKLLSMGCNDLGVGEMTIAENLLMQRNEAYVGDMGVSGIVRRNNSLPPLRHKDSYQKKSVIEREGSAISKADLVPRILEENTDNESIVHNVDLEKKSENSDVGNFDSYWEQIMKLDERVKEISDCKDSGQGKSVNLKNESRSCSLHSRASAGTSCHLTREQPRNLLETETIVYSACSSSVHDVFEVPTNNKNHKGPGRQKKEQGKFSLEDENRLGKPESVFQEASKSCVVDETDWVKKMFDCTNNEKNLLKKTDGVPVDCHLALVHPTISVAQSQAQIQQLSMRMKRLENDRKTIRPEISGGEEELELLREIREKLNSIQSEITSWRIKKSPPPDESSIVSLTEAMLYFWL
ncbi:hypothetical protein L1049_022015 [Liquidambar formosana]|uniref:GTD-binding domain-containing protein n=1 Tax=Liquidambar formosana TaxID=63359 RepID=A0AAP0WQD4_LIQFO